MKRYLLFVIAFVCVQIGAWAGYDVTINTNNSNNTSDWTINGGLTWGCPNSVTVSNRINNDGIYYIHQQCAQNGDYAAGKVPLNLTGATLDADVTTFGDAFGKISFASGVDVSKYSYGSALTYAISQGEPTYIYAASGTTLSNISELTTPLSGSFVVYGPGKSALEAEILDNGGTLGFDGSASVAAGNVASDAAAIINENGIAATDIKHLTVTAGTLTDADVTYINNTLTGVQSIDLSAATATATQIGSLLDNSSATSITLGNGNIANLQAGSGNTIDMDKIADNITGSALAKGMTNTNYIIDGNTLIVTGLMTAAVEAEIRDLVANKGITSLDVSNVTNTSDYTIAKIDGISQVSLPGSGYVKYADDSVIKLVDGVLEVSIGDGGQYASLEAMYTALGDVLDEVEHLKITGTIPDMDKLMTSTNYQSGAICSLGGHENIKTLDLSEVTNTNFSDINCNNNCPTAILLPEGTDLTDSNLKAKNANFFAQDSEKEAQLNVLVNNADGPNNGTALANGAYFADQLGSTILKVYNGKSASGGAGAPALTAYKEYSTVSIVDLTSAQSNTNTTYNTEEKQEEAKDELSTFKTVLSPVDSNKKQLVIDGPLTNDVLEAISSIANGNITSIDFSGATVEGTLDWSKLTGYDNVEYVKLPSTVATNALSTTTLPALKAAGSYDEDSKTGAIHVYQEVANGATKGFSATFPGANNTPVFNDAEGLTLTGTLNANSLVLTNKDNTTAVVGNSLKSVNLTATEFAAGVTPKANMIVPNNADIIAPASLTSTADLENYAASDGNNSYSNVYAIENGTAHVLYNNGTTFASRSNDYFTYAGNVGSLSVHTSNAINANGIANLSDFNSVNVDELDFSEAYIQTKNNDAQTLANTNITSLVMNGTHGAYNNAVKYDISGCTKLTSADMRLADGQLKQLNAAGLSNLVSLQLTEASFDTPINVPSTTLKAGYVDVTGSNLSNLTVYGDSEFNKDRIIPADDVNIEEGAAPAYKVNGCQITINMPEDGTGVLDDILAEAISKISDPNKVICRLTINGPVTETDMKCDALKNAKAATIDMQKAQFADNSILANLKNNYVEHLATPYGCDDILDLKALGTNNPNLTVVGTYGATESGEMDNTKFTAYSFDSNNMYDFITDLFPEINNNLRYSSSEDSEHYPTSLTLGGHIGDQDLVKNNERVFKSDKIYDMDLTECDFDENCTVSIKSTESYGGTPDEKTGINSGAAQLTCTSTNAMYYLSSYTPKNVILPKYDTEIPPLTFNDNTKGVKLESVTFPEGSNYTKIGFEAFYKTAIEQFVMPGTVQEVGEGAFASCESMTDFTMEPCQSNCTFGERTFSGSKNIKHVTLSEGVQNLPYMMFNQCASLEEIGIPNSCKTIGSYAFNLCFSLHVLTIPRGVETMGRGVISLSGVKDIYLMAKTVDEVPLIYAVPNDNSGYIGTFGDQNINGNNTDPRNGTREHSDLCHIGWEDALKWYQEELSGSAGLGTGNCMTLIHFPDEMRDFYDGYPDPDLWKGNVISADNDILTEKINLMDRVETGDDAKDTHKWISDGYGYGSKEWDAQHQGNKGNSDPSLITGCDHTHSCSLDDCTESGGVCSEDCEKCEKLQSWPVQSDYAIRRAVGAVGSYDEDGKQIRTAEAWRQFPLMTGAKEEGKNQFELLYDDTWYTMCFPWHMTDNQLFVAFNQKCEIAEFVGAEMLADGTTTDAQGNEEVSYNLVFHFDKVAKTYYMDDEDNFYKRELETTRSVTYNGVTINKKYYKYTLLTEKDGEETTTVITDPYPYDEENHSAEDGERHVKYLSIQNIIPLAGHPYMIHPYKGTSPGVPVSCPFYGIERKTVGKDATDTWSAEKQKVTVTVSTNTKADWESAIGKNSNENPDMSGIVPFVSPKTNAQCQYTFIGNIDDDFDPEEMTFDVTKKADMPLGDYNVAYYLAVKKPTGATKTVIDPNGSTRTITLPDPTDNDQVYPKYYRKVKNGTGKWSVYSAIIVPELTAYNGIETLSDYVEYFDKPESAKAATIMFGEWEVVSPTAIKEIIADAEQKGEKVQKAHLNVVYSVNGQVVRTGTDSLEGLPSGMYIVNGKKYMVK